MGTDVHSIIGVKKDVFLKVHPELSKTINQDSAWIEIPENPQLKDDQPTTPIGSNTTHVRVWWAINLQSKITDFHDDVVKPLMDKYGDFRLVLSFDS